MSPKSIVNLGNDQSTSDWMPKLQLHQCYISSSKMAQLTPANSMAQSSKPKFLTMRMRTQNLALNIMNVKPDSSTVVASNPAD